MHTLRPIHPFSLPPFISFILLGTPYFLPPLLCPISPPPLIAPLVPPFLQIHCFSCLPPLIGATWYLSPHCSRSDHLFPSACSQLCLCIAVHAPRWDGSNSWDTTTNLSINQSCYHLLALPLVFECAFVCINAFMGVPFICFHFSWTSSLFFSPFIEFWFHEGFEVVWSPPALSLHLYSPVWKSSQVRQYKHLCMPVYELSLFCFFFPSLYLLTQSLFLFTWNESLFSTSVCLRLLSFAQFYDHPESQHLVFTPFPKLDVSNMKCHATGLIVDHKVKWDKHH